MQTSRKLCIIGGGKMGGVLTQGILSRQLFTARDVTVSDVVPERLQELAGLYGVNTSEDNRTAAGTADIIILAVKPQGMESVLRGLAGFIRENQLVISIAAGISTGFIEERLDGSMRVLRAMPNTPALVGAGITALAGGTKIQEDDLALARDIFSAVGAVVEVKEDLMDAVTGLSGSGPAYVFVIIEALADAGVHMGLDRKTSLQLATQTILGAARLCLESGKHPAELKDMVASPGGTTIAGLRALEEGRLRATLMAAVEAATARSRQLGGR
jgi:pyrroline-5-carboxylate reductase